MEDKSIRAVSDEMIVAALLQSDSIQSAADALGVTARTVHMRMTKDHFRAIYAATQAGILRSAVSCLKEQLNDALMTVSGIMKDTDASAGVRLQAARILIDQAGKYVDRLQGAEDVAYLAAIHAQSSRDPEEY